MVNIYRSRRGYNHRCLHWSRKTSGAMDNEQLIHNTRPDSIFYAKIMTDKFKDKQDSGGVFRNGFENVTIETYDYVDIRTDDKVYFKGRIWLVRKVNDTPIEKNAEFSSKEDEHTKIELVTNDA